MSGTIAGGKLAAKKNLERDPEFYRKIGQIGGRNGHTGGYYWMKQNGKLEKIRDAGRKGGTISRRGPSKKMLAAMRTVQPQAQRATVAMQELTVSAQRGTRGFGRLWAGFRRTRGGERERV